VGPRTLSVKEITSFTDGQNLCIPLWDICDLARTELAMQFYREKLVEAGLVAQAS
jgi:hypothetical protein